MPNNTEELVPEQNADKTKDIFVGTWRPPFIEVLKTVKIIPTLLVSDSDSFGTIDNDGKAAGCFRTRNQAKEKWLMGDFDLALYKKVIAVN